DEAKGPGIQRATHVDHLDGTAVDTPGTAGQDEDRGEDEAPKSLHGPDDRRPADGGVFRTAGPPSGRSIVWAMSKMVLVADEPWVVSEVTAALAGVPWNYVGVSDPEQVTEVVEQTMPTPWSSTSRWTPWAEWRSPGTSVKGSIHGRVWSFSSTGM